MDEMHEWASANRIGEAFPDAAGRMLALEATFVQAKDDGVTRLEAGEDVWALTLGMGTPWHSLRPCGKSTSAWHLISNGSPNWDYLGIARSTPS